MFTLNFLLSQGILVTLALKTMNVTSLWNTPKQLCVWDLEQSSLFHCFLGMWNSLKFMQKYNNLLKNSSFLENCRTIETKQLVRYFNDHDLDTAYSLFILTRYFIVGQGVNFRSANYVTHSGVWLYFVVNNISIFITSMLFVCILLIESCFVVCREKTRKMRVTKMSVTWQIFPGKCLNFRRKKLKIWREKGRGPTKNAKNYKTDWI